MDKKEILKTVKFTLFSISAGIIQALSFALLNDVIKIPSWSVNYVVSLALSVLWNFTLNRTYTFQSASNVPIAMLKVALFYVVFAPASTALGNYLTGTLLWNEYLVTGLNMIGNLVLEFFYDKYYVFKDTLNK